MSIWYHIKLIEALSYLIKILDLAQNQLNEKVKALRTDRDAKYLLE